MYSKKVLRRSRHDPKLHCMMDDIGKLHPNNVNGIQNSAETTETLFGLTVHLRN